MIPRVIHYCWFGRGPKPALAEKCISSWKKYCPEFQIKEWNEDNFNIYSIPYVEEAYSKKKFAFVTDYVRLFALYTEGGIYMDTDVELVSSVDAFLDFQAFSGFESTTHVPTGIMASEANVPIVKELLQYYDDRHFQNQDGSLDMTTNCESITETMVAHGLNLNNMLQTVEGFTFFPSDYFCPFENETGRLNRTTNTVAIHWFNKSWLPESVRRKSKITRIFHRLFGVNCFAWLKRR